MRNTNQCGETKQNQMTQLDNSSNDATADSHILNKRDFVPKIQQPGKTATTLNKHRKVSLAQRVCGYPEGMRNGVLLLGEAFVQGVSPKLENLATQAQSL